MKKINTRHIILASNSPRRKLLLEQAGIDFTVVPADIDETDGRSREPDALVKALSFRKAVTVSEKHPDTWVLGADTIVTADGDLLEKPESKAHARRMLEFLSNRRHTVFTGFTLCCSGRKRYTTRSVKTDVYFKSLSDEEIAWYTETDEPYDKAGGYAIQGMGAFLVKKIDGSYTNVVGLPVCEVMAVLVLENIVNFTGKKR